ncbi:MAG: SCO family protein [Pseudomonadota bacterium]
MHEQPMSQRDGTEKNFVFIVAGLFALLLGVVVWLNYSTPPTESQQKKIETQRATVLPQLKKLRPFALFDQQGKPFDNQSLLGQWTFLSFGYTHCPDICPTTMALLTNMKQRLQSVETALPYKIAFVSVDPERDTQQRLAEYVSYFDPSFIGVTGSDDELKRLTQPLGILFAKVETEKSAMGYVMDHSASIILVDPQGRYHALFSPPHDAAIMTEDFIAITENY